MTDSRQPSAGCLDPETLAAFIDGRLEPRERAAVEAHLAECEGCYEAWMEARDLTLGLAHSAGENRRRWTQKRMWFAAVAAAILMGSATAWFTWYRGSSRATVHGTVALLAETVGTSRVAEARLSGPFQHGPIPSARRGNAGASLGAAVQQHTVALRLLATQRRSTETLWGAGVAFIVEGDADSAIDSFEAAVEMDPRDVPIRVDASAAYLERYRQTGGMSDVAAAIGHTTIASELDPSNAEAAFNRALALEVLGPRSDAIAEWERYLRLDPASKWADEAKVHLDRLRRISGPAKSIDALTDVLRDRILGPWAATEGPRGANDWSEARRIDAVLRPAGAAAMELRVAALAATGAPHDPRMRCLASYVRSEQSWRASYEHERYDEASQAAKAQLRAAACAGVNSIDARLNLAFTTFATGGVAQGLAELGAERDQLAEEGLVLQAARIAILEALAALQSTDLDAGARHYAACEALAALGGSVRTGAWCSARRAAVLADQGQSDAAWLLISQALPALDSVESPRLAFLIVSPAVVIAERTKIKGAEWHFCTTMLARTAKWESPAAQVLAHSRRARLSAEFSPAQAPLELERARIAVGRFTDPVRREVQQTELDLIDGEISLETEPRRSIGVLTAGIEFLESRSNRYRTPALLLLRGRANAALGDLRAAEADWTQAAALSSLHIASIKDPAIRVARLDLLWDIFEELIGAQQDRPEIALATTDRSHAADLAAALITREAPVLDTASLVKRLPRGVAIVAYASLQDRLLIWTITRHGITLDPVDLSQEALARSVDSVLSRLQGPTPRVEDEVHFSTQILPRGLDFTSISTLVIVPDGQLHRLPFGALRLPDGRYLAEGVAPVIAPTLSAFLDASEYSWREVRGRTLMIQADNASGKDLPRLPWVRQEIDAIRGHHAGPVEVVDGASTSGDELVARLPRASLVHFSGHAIMDLTHPSRSRLVLSSDGEAAVSLEQLQTMKLRSGALVVLAGCETAIGRLYRGHGAQSLSRPFLAAGASGVIGALWAVRDAQTADLISRFYDELAQSHPWLALAKAQRHAIGRSLPPWAWAGLTYSGGIDLNRARLKETD